MSGQTVKRFHDTPSLTVRLFVHPVLLSYPLFRSTDFEFSRFFKRNPSVGCAISGKNDSTPTNVSGGLSDRGSAQPGCAGGVGKQRNQRSPELFVAGAAPVSLHSAFPKKLKVYFGVLWLNMNKSMSRSYPPNLLSRQ